MLPVKYRSRICLTYSCNAESRRRHADTKGLELITLTEHVVSRRGDLARNEKQLQEAQAVESKNLDSWVDLVETAQSRLDEDVAELTDASEAYQLAKAGYFSEFGYEVDSELVERMMQSA